MWGLMKRYCWSLIVFACSLAHADSACKVSFAVVWKDSLNNVKQGLRPEDLKWIKDKMAKKYPELCYEQGAPPVVLWVSAADATYHSTRTVSNSGTVRDATPGSDTYGQTVATTETDQEVLHSFEYTVYTLSLEQKQPDGAWKVMHNFRHDTIQRQMYGIAIKNRHPNQQLIESALKWMHDGGLTDQCKRWLIISGAQ
jgi:hypothetical protein